MAQWFNSQHPHGVVTPISRGLIPSSGLSRQQAHCGAQIDLQAKVHTHKIKIKKLFLINSISWLLSSVTNASQFLTGEVTEDPGL